MAGGSRRQSALALRIGAARDAARKPECVAFQSDQKVRVLATGRATYPDATVVCGAIEGDPADPSGEASAPDSGRQLPPGGLPRRERPFARVYWSTRKTMSFPGCFRLR